jgi:hypothetical protein
VRNLLGNGVFATDGGDTDVGGFAGFGEGVVAAVEVLALLRPPLAKLSKYSAQSMVAP